MLLNARHVVFMGVGLIKPAVGLKGAAAMKKHTTFGYAIT